MIKLELELYDCFELDIAHAALEKIQMKRDGRWKDKLTGCGCQSGTAVTPTKINFIEGTVSVLDVLNEDIPPVPIEQAIEEAHAATNEDVIAAINTANRAGVQAVPIVTAFVGEKGVQRVSNLTDAQRGELVAKLQAAVAAK